MILLTELKEGESARIVEIIGGRGVRQKLDALGIRVGVKVKKVSSLMWRGPIVIMAENTQVAIGWGMAQKIVVVPEK